uniref:Uncharacterized protein n=1 Tax=Amorphochlora amoebiformis TaxID=1561963 RepID=A0A7S0DN52_9EUKA
MATAPPTTPPAIAAAPGPESDPLLCCDWKLGGTVGDKPGDPSVSIRKEKSKGVGFGIVMTPLALQPLTESTLPVWTRVKVWPSRIPTTLAAVHILDVERIELPLSGQPTTAPVQISTKLHLTR